MEGLPQVSPGRALRNGIAQSHRGRGFRFLRRDDVGPRADAGSGDRRHRRHERRARPGGRSALYSPLFSRRREGQGASDGRRFDRRVSRPHLTSGVDVARTRGRRRWTSSPRSGSASVIPDTWIDYAKLDVVRGDAFGNMRRAEAFNRSRNLAKLRQPADPDEWRIDPQMFAAVIVFTPNTETFSAGLLQPPYFDGEGDAASNYGSAGAGIAHEITHSFDELGNIYDDQGRLRRWWTPEDLAELSRGCPRSWPRNSTATAHLPASASTANRCSPKALPISPACRWRTTPTSSR